MSKRDLSDCEFLTECFPLEIITSDKEKLKRILYPLLGEAVEAGIEYNSDDTLMDYVEDFLTNYTSFMQPFNYTYGGDPFPIPDKATQEQMNSYYILDVSDIVRSMLMDRLEAPVSNLFNNDLLHLLDRQAYYDNLTSLCEVNQVLGEVINRTLVGMLLNNERISMTNNFPFGSKTLAYISTAPSSPVDGVPAYLIISILLPKAIDV